MYVCYTCTPVHMYVYVYVRMSAVVCSCRKVRVSGEMQRTGLYTRRFIKETRWPFYFRERDSWERACWQVLRHNSKPSVQTHAQFSHVDTDRCTIAAGLLRNVACHSTLGAENNYVAMKWEAVTMSLYALYQRHFSHGGTDRCTAAVVCL